MNVLEKILEEIEEETFQEDSPLYLGDMEVDGYVRASRVKEIIRSHMNEADTDWILVKERLPEEGQKVLTTHEPAACKEYQVIEHYYYNGEFLNNWYMDIDFSSPTFGQRYMGNVIAWRPLPEPYKGE